MITLSVMMFVKQLDPRKRPAKKNTSSFDHGMSDGWDSNNGLIPRWGQEHKHF